MIIHKKIKVIILGIILSIPLNIIYFKVLNNESYLGIVGKAVSINYLSFEPIVLRGSFVKDFDIQCKKKNCLPFSKIKTSKRIQFIKELYKVLKNEPNSSIYVSILLVDDYFNDLRFYIQNPIYIDTKALGIAYYSKDSFIEEYKERYSISYNYHHCNQSLQINENKSRGKYLYDLFKLLDLKISCDYNYLNELKEKKIKYIIDHKNYLTKNKIIFCKDELCLAYL
ncbi:hypothetical protein [Candidatus Pelagibacter sp. HIMB1611]|uniref:hypothetical protein n=1 Tax=unclassified Candidatus Pelagibacter TaxID=2647897 RepID=UPI003F86E6C4